jgi:BlaI family transcriptional regulator, penicillinase repressor
MPPRRQISRPRAPEPTGVELEILAVLWRIGPSTVRQVHLALAAEKGTGYSTTLKMMQVMREKGLLLRDDSVRPQVYRPAASQERTQLQLLDNLVQKAFNGSALRLLLSALSAKRVSPQELAEVEQIIRQAKDRQPRPGRKA